MKEKSTTASGTTATQASSNTYPIRAVERDEQTALYRVDLAFRPDNTRPFEAFLGQASGPLRRLSMFKFRNSTL